MKKRIIAFALVVVMAVAALVGCGESVFNYASEDLTPYAKFEMGTFAEALASIKIEDADFTTDETVRAQKVLQNIYNTLSDKVVAVGDKVYNTVIGERDVVYYNYYATVDYQDATHTIFFESMEEARVTNSDHKSNHVIELGKTTSTSDKLANEFREKLIQALAGKNLTAAYATDSTKGASLKNLPEGTTLVISYKLSVVDAEGNPKPDLGKTVNYEVVTVGSDNALLTALLTESYNNTVGNDATFADGVKTYMTTDSAGNKLTYSNVKVKWKVADLGEEMASFTMVRYGETSSATATSANNVSIPLKGLEITYHIYPVYVIKVPEYDAKSLVKYIFGSSIKTTSLEIFEDESYTVEGGAKLPELIEELGKIYAGTTEKNTAVKEAKQAYDEAKAAVDEAGKDVTNNQENALKTATEALEKAKKAAAETAIEEILTASSTATDAKPIAEAITSEYEDGIRHSLEETYNNAIFEAVAKKVYEAIEKSVTLTGEYPESVVKAAYDRLYESYEYSFYNGKHDQSTVSEYSHHKGDFADYLENCALKGKVEEVDGDIWPAIEKAITEEAKAQIAPIIKIYVVAKALEADAKVDLAEWADADKAAGRFDAELDREDYDSDEKYQEALDEAKNKTFEKAKKEADTFLVTDDVINQYKEEIGKAAYDYYISNYGEVNLRAGLQFNKLMNYLTSLTVEKTDDGHNHVKYTPRDGVLYLDFRYEGLIYTTVEDTGADE